MHIFLIFLLFVLLVAPVTAVPGCHGGRDKDHRRQENCTAAGFTGVPTGLEPATKVLLFPQNLFSSLSWSSFQIFTEIYEIDLTGNKSNRPSSRVDPSSAPILPSLSVLRLGSNRLTSLPDGSFSACPALTELYLEGNAVVSLSDNTFSGLSKLEILDLSYNRIQVLPQLMLQPLAVIETLYIEYNKVLTMPDGWFDPKEEVPYLFLSANPWACSCSLGYLRGYLDEYEYNVYVRDGPIFTTDPLSVVCDSPRRHKATAATTTAGDDSVTGRFRSVRGAGVFCFWLFAGCFLLCLAAAAAILATVARMLFWYRREGGVEEERGGTEGVYRNTMYRVMSKEEEVGGRKVMEECQVSGRKGGEWGRKGGEWGIPGSATAMPWGVAPPPEGEAAQ
ncbi:Platelet glycoprotein Ib alpha chain [Dissostichus eleginoides]|uniref:Platelet glycoprotein Ib alpha chain n=1 Tax=Dissostichus eleginoides TaxID=100907 RepID=A0AAD9BXJ5_DISEL|nr:Platelet glycoprotein Ib alpha chain [Dissostichus eleginoides]